MSICNFISSLLGRKKCISFSNGQKKVQDIEKNKKTGIQFYENLKLFAMLIETIPNPIFYKNVDGVYKHCNTAFLEYLGLKKEQVINHTAYDINPKKLADSYHKADIELLKNKDKQRYETKVKHSDGSYHDVILNKAALINNEGKVGGLVGIIADITEHKKTEKRINRLLKLNEAMVEVSYSVIGTNNINELFELILEKTIESIENANIGSILVLDKEENLKIFAYKGYETEKVENFSVKLKNSYVWYETEGKIDRTVIVNDVDKFDKIKALDTEKGNKIKSTISAPIFIERQLYGFVNVDSIYNYAFDQTDLEVMEYMRNQIEIAISKHKLYEEIVYLSRFDKLTNVYNRRYFEELFDTCVDKLEKKFSLVVFDLNELKGINDTYGHLVGDELIKTFAGDLGKCVRSSDILARIGGDEFVGIFFDVDSQTLVKRFDKLIKKFENNPITFEGNNIICSFSYGIANFPEEGNNVNKLMKTADKRMYEYKYMIKNMHKLS